MFSYCHKHAENQYCQCYTSLCVNNLILCECPIHYVFVLQGVCVLVAGMVSTVCSAQMTV
jgi:hypothetical protein